MEHLLCAKLEDDTKGWVEGCPPSGSGRLRQGEQWAKATESVVIWGAGAIPARATTALPWYLLLRHLLANPEPAKAGQAACQVFPVWARSLLYTPLRHPQPPWPGDERGALSHKGSSAPGRGTGSALGNRLQRQTGFLGSHVQGGRGPGKSIPFQELASRRLAPLVTSFVASGTLPNANNSSRRAARFCCKHFAYFKLQATTTVQ